MENDESRIPKSESNPISARVGRDVRSQRNTAEADAILMRANFCANVLALARCAETSAIAFLAGVISPCRSRSSWSPVLDYGGGDGKFAVLCAESLSLQEIVTYDPAPRMTSLARSLCANFKQIRVAEAIQEIQSGRFDVVTFNAVWMCLTSREACLDTLSEIARLLRSNGRLVASVTHPCFRTCKFSNYFTDLNNSSSLIAATSNCCFQFQKRTQFFVCTHNETFSVIAMRISQSRFVHPGAPELSPSEAPTGFAEFVSAQS